MNRVLKTFLLWLLIAALPIQGWAAALKTSCSPGHTARTAERAVKTILHQPGMPHAHHRDAIPHPMPVFPDAKVPQNISTSGHGHHNASFKSSFCSVCALCCYGAIAPPSALILPPVLDSSDALFTAPPPSVAWHIPPRLERPPRRDTAGS